VKVQLHKGSGALFSAGSAGSSSCAHRISIRVRKASSTPSPGYVGNFRQGVKLITPNEIEKSDPSMILVSDFNIRKNLLKSVRHLVRGRGKKCPAYLPSPVFELTGGWPSSFFLCPRIFPFIH